MTAALSPTPDALTTSPGTTIASTVITTATTSSRADTTGLPTPAVPAVTAGRTAPRASCTDSPSTTPASAAAHGCDCDSRLS